MSEITVESPLIGRTEAVHGANTQASGGTVVYERPFLGHISLRGHADDGKFTQACTKVLGIDLPMTPNTATEDAGIAVCWMGPDEWLVLCGEPGARQSWLDSLRVALGDTHSAVTDLSGGQTVIAIQGEHAADVLAKGTMLDLHPRVFGAGRCTRTLIARSAAFIRVIEPGRAFEIVVRRSFADYLWQWLRDAAGEYDIQVLAPQSSLQTGVRRTG